jgi:hypothetical protein
MCALRSNFYNPISKCGTSKLKLSPAHAVTTLLGSRGNIAPTLFGVSTRHIWVVRLTLWLATKGPLIPTGWEAGWDPDPVWMQKLEEKLLAPARNQTPVMTLYWLSYPGSQNVACNWSIYPATEKELFTLSSKWYSLHLTATLYLCRTRQIVNILVTKYTELVSPMGHVK